MQRSIVSQSWLNKTLILGILKIMGDSILSFKLRTSMQLLIFSFQAQSWINDLNFSLLLEHQDFSNKKTSQRSRILAYAIQISDLI